MTDNGIDSVASRLHEITEQLATSGRRLVEHDEKGRIVATTDVLTNHRRLVENGIAVMEAAWSHQPASVDAQGRFEQLLEMRRFCVAAAEHAPEQAVEMRERVRQLTNSIRLNFDDPG